MDIKTLQGEAVLLLSFFVVSCATPGPTRPSTSLRAHALGQVIDAQVLPPVVEEEEPPSAPGCEGPVVLNAPDGIPFQLHYGFEQTKVPSVQEERLEALVEIFEMYEGLVVEVRGHRDSQEPSHFSRDLSEKRARKVAEELQKRGVSSAQIVGRGYGDSFPVESNETEAGRAANRRVDFVVADAQPKDPCHASLDSDGDQIPDYKDQCPEEAESYNCIDDHDGCAELRTPLEQNGDALVIRAMILFAFELDQVDPYYDPFLDGLAKLLGELEWLELEIRGHMDVNEEHGYAKPLSSRRAEAVRDALISRGVAPSQLTSLGYGEDMPIDTNRTEEGRANNRRVDFQILAQPKSPREAAREPDREECLRW